MNNQEKAAKLREARALIDTPENWFHGQELESKGFCAVTACTEATRGGHWLDEVMLDYELLITLELPPGGSISKLSKYNDTHTHAEVLALFDKTIARLEEL